METTDKNKSSVEQLEDLELKRQGWEKVDAVYSTFPPYYFNTITNQRSYKKPKISTSIAPKNSLVESCCFTLGIEVKEIISSHEF